MLENWQYPFKDSYRYLESVLQAVNTELKDFRLNPDIRHVIENSTYPGALRDIAYINSQNDQIWQWVDKFRKSDTIGNPETFEFDKIGRFSPSTIRYIMALVGLIKHFGDINGWVIAEIGAGYGGFCKIIHDGFAPKLYVLYDLKPCLEMQAMFLSYFMHLPPLQYDLTVPIRQDSIDLIIACCSWSELLLPARKEYLDKVISKAKRGYIMINLDFEENVQLIKDKMPDKKFIFDSNNPQILIFK